MRLQVAIARLIRTHRLELGLPQSNLAKRARTHRPLIARAENGAHELMLRTLLRYAEALGCSVTDLVRAGNQLCALEEVQRAQHPDADPRQQNVPRCRTKRETW